MIRIAFERDHPDAVGKLLAHLELAPTASLLCLARTPERPLGIILPEEHRRGTGGCGSTSSSNDQQGLGISCFNPRPADLMKAQGDSGDRAHSTTGAPRSDCP